MKVRTSTIPLALAFCLALAISVQAKTKRYGTSAGNRITVTGCLQSGATPDTFVLNNATIGTAKTARNQSVNAPNEMARSEVSSFMLIPGGKINLQKFVGQTVRVTGRTEGEQSMNAPPAAAPDSTEPSQSSVTGQGDLKVLAIHKIAGVCR